MATVGVKPLATSQLAFWGIWSGWKFFCDGTWPLGVLAPWWLPYSWWRWTLHAQWHKYSLGDHWSAFPVSLPCLVFATTPPFVRAGMASWTTLAAGGLIRLCEWRQVGTAKLQLENRAGTRCGRLKGSYCFSCLLCMAVWVADYRSESNLSQQMWVRRSGMKCLSHL